MSQKKPKFLRTDVKKFSKLGIRRKNKQKYRKAKGRDNKIRLNMKGHLRNVKVDNLVNNEIRFRGMRKPLHKIKVKAKKYDNGIVRVELIDIPTHVKFSKLREEKKKAELDKKLKEKPKIKKAEEEKEEESEESKEKEQASKEEGLKISKNQAKEMKHTSKDKKVIVQRKALAK